MLTHITKLTENMKPYEKAQKEKLPAHRDRRVKYTPHDKIKVRRCFFAMNHGVRQIARNTGISRRTIQFWLFPDRLEKNKENYKKRGQARKSYEKERGEKWNTRQREIKERKYRIYKANRNLKNEK